MSPKAFVAALAILLLPGASAQAATNLVVNGGFEDDLLWGWDTWDGPNELYRYDDYSGLTPTEGLAMAVFEPRVTASLWQGIPLQAGQRYRLSFDLAIFPFAADIFSVRWGSFGELLNINYTQFIEFVSYSYEVTARTNTTQRLSFGASSANGPGAFLLDNVSVTQLTTVPEPSTWVTMILGLGAAGVGLRRRRSATTPTPTATSPA